MPSALVATRHQRSCPAVEADILEVRSHDDFAGQGEPRGQTEAGVLLASPTTIYGQFFRGLDRWYKRLPKAGSRQVEISDRPSTHLIVDVVCLANRQRNDRQGRITRSGARKLATVADEQIFDVMGLTPPVANSITGFLAHP
jgi:hypothetical protein